MRTRGLSRKAKRMVLVNMALQRGEPIPPPKAPRPRAAKASGEGEGELTPTQARILAHLRKMGDERRFNGRRERPLKALERRGLIELRCQPEPNCGSICLAWYARAVPAADWRADS